MTIAWSLLNKIKKVQSLGLSKTTRRILDKAKRKFQLLPSVPPTVYIELTDICNLECVMCDRHGMTRKSGLMEMSLYKRIIDNAAEIGVPAVKLNRFGESLIHPGLFDMIGYAKDREISHVYFTSNATLLNDEKAEKLARSGLDTIIFSFDGAMAETYEKIRIKANYEGVVGNIVHFAKLKKKLGKDKPNIVINSVLMRDTQDEIFKVFEMWEPYVDKINILPVGKYGNVEDLAPIRRDNGMIERRPCHQISDRMMIFWDGLVTVCCVDINGDLTVGNIRDSRIEDLWTNPVFTDLRRKHLRRELETVPTCQSCDITDARYYDEMQALRRDVYRQARSRGFTRF